MSSVHQARRDGGREEGLSEVRRRMGMWKARVLRETRRRKKRYCRMRG